MESSFPRFATDRPLPVRTRSWKRAAGTVAGMGWQRPWWLSHSGRSAATEGLSYGGVLSQSNVLYRKSGLWQGLPTFRRLFSFSRGYVRSHRLWKGVCANLSQPQRQERSNTGAPFLPRGFDAREGLGRIGRLGGRLSD